MNDDGERRRIPGRTTTKNGIDPAIILKLAPSALSGGFGVAGGFLESLE
jgi:hypothetical protein